MGAQGEDILLSEAARKLLPYSIECKSRHSFAVYKLYEQAKEYKYTPVLVLKGNNKPPLVVLSLDTFLELNK